MKRFLIFIFAISIAFSAHSINSYRASYDLYGQTDLGNIKFGSADYELIVANNSYVFTSKAKTDKLWSALYNLLRIETSIGLIIDDKLVSDYYKIIENQGDSISDQYEINIFPKEKYATLNNLIVADDILESSNEKNSVEIVDALNIYLHISLDIQKYPNKKKFVYKLVDKKGLNQREYFIDGFETIKIDNKKVETIRIKCPELKLVFNVSKDHNFMPVYILKTNGETNFELKLKDYKE